MDPRSLRVSVVSVLAVAFVCSMVVIQPRSQVDACPPSREAALQMLRNIESQYPGVPRSYYLNRYGGQPQPANIIPGQYQNNLVPGQNNIPGQYNNIPGQYNNNLIPGQNTIPGQYGNNVVPGQSTIPGQSTVPQYQGQ